MFSAGRSYIWCLFGSQAAVSEAVGKGESGGQAGNTNFESIELMGLRLGTPLFMNCR